MIVGGYAVIFHSQPRFTKDIDIFIQADPSNAEAVYEALRSFGASLEGIRPEEFADRGNFFRFGHDPHGFDILPDLPGVEFEQAWEHRIEATIDHEKGTKAFFISAPDLIANKLAAGRPQDLADAAAISKALEAQRQDRSRK